MKKVFIVGIDGNMGQRYKACLTSIGVEVVGVDKNCNVGDHTRVDGYIIATPTSAHLSDLATYGQYEKPILCEKPLTTSLTSLETFAHKYRKYLINIRMVNQYKYLIDQHSYGDTTYGDTTYDYFRSGKDGLAWDCINIVGLSNKRPVLESTSPVWYCMINGTTLGIEKMDRAYVAMIKDWVRDPRPNWAYAYGAHEKVEQWLKS